MDRAASGPPRRAQHLVVQRHPSSAGNGDVLAGFPVDRRIQLGRAHRRQLDPAHHDGIAGQRQRGRARIEATAVQQRTHGLHDGVPIGDGAVGIIHGARRQLRDRERGQRACAPAAPELDGLDGSSIRCRGPRAPSATSASMILPARVLRRAGPAAAACRQCAMVRLVPWQPLQSGRELVRCVLDTLSRCSVRFPFCARRAASRRPAGGAHQQPTKWQLSYRPTPITSAPGT